MKKKNIVMLCILILFIVGIYIISGNDANDLEAEKVIQNQEFVANEEYENVSKELILTNNEENFLINDEVVPEELRVKKGTNLTIKVKNNSEYETSIHFHGINGLSKMDGVGGLSQNNIKPGESFEYKFSLDEPGTYMYHSHVDSQDQVNNENLYGGLVVEGNKHENEDMLLFNTNIDDEERHHFANLSYDEVLVNGENSDEYNLNSDENLFLNLANLSSAPISINFGNDVKYKVTSLDANEASSDWQINQGLIIPTAQRVIVEIENPQKSFQISTSINNVKNAKYNVYYQGDMSNIENNPINSTEKTKNSMMSGSSMMNEEEYDNLEVNANYIYDITESKEGLGLKDKEVDKKFDMELSMDNGMWVIDDKAYPKTKNLEVREGDVVEISLKNTSHMASTHPFHLHGHKFEIVSMNGEKVDKNLVMDTVDVKPNEEITIRLTADNPGIWAFHCHNLNHAALGMMTLFTYEGYTTNATNTISE